MNMSFWSHCQGLVRRLQKRRLARPRARWRGWGLAETLEARALLSSTPAMVADIVAGPDSSNVQNLVAIGSTIYFTASDSTHGHELWMSDGTTAGTRMVKDVNLGAGSSSPGSLINVNGTLYFTATNGINGVELWKSDGTTAGTSMVKDINPGFGGDSNLGNFTNVNGTLFFTANDGANGLELWKSNGTAIGTVMVLDIGAGSAGSNPTSLTNVNGTLYFIAKDTVQWRELWKSDGTVAGTTMVTANFDPAYLTNVNGTLFFVSGSSSMGLFKTDGTEAGTVWISNGTGPSTNVNGTLFFASGDWWTGIELFKSDGTTAGTTMVKDILPGMNYSYTYPYGGGWNPNSSYPASLTSVNGTLFFIVRGNYRDGTELWMSDGTDAGTVPFRPNGMPAGRPIDVSGTLYFTANDGINGEELWKSDSTEAAAVMVKDIKPGVSGSFARNLTNANGMLFFTANDGAHGTELWVLNTAPTPSLGVSGFPATITAGSAGSVTITAKNADGTTNTGYLGTVHFTSSDPQAVLPADYTFTAADHGVHNFTAKLKTAGSQSMTATDTQAVGMDGALSNIVVKPAAASTMTVSGFPSTTTAGVAGNFTVTLKDPYGNIASGYVGTVRLTSSDAQAVLPVNYMFTAADAGRHTFSVTLTTAGTRSITVADTLIAVLTATQGGITVNAGVASQFLISAPSSIKAGEAFSLTLTVKDAYGNVVTGYTGTVRFTSTDNSAKLPANYTFKSTDQGVHTFTGLILRKKGNQKITITDTWNSLLTASVVASVR